MRPFLVLLVVAAAAGGLFYALSGGDGPNDIDPSGQESVVRRDAESDTPDTREEAELEGLTGEGERVVGEIETAPQSVLDDNEAEASMAGLGSLTGRVLVKEGVPIVGAEVRLTLHGSQSFLFTEPDDSEDVIAETGDDGSYVFTNVPVREGWAVIADHPDYSRTELASVIIVDGEVTVAPDILLGTGSIVRGRVTDTGGNAVPGAQLILSESRFAAVLEENSRSGNDYAATTDDLGNFEIKNVAPRPNYTLSITADGYGSIQVTPLAVVEDEDTVQEITLEIAAMLGGSVTSATGEPIENASVEAWAVDRTKRSTHTRVKTNEVGEFLFDDIPTGQFQLIVRHPAHAANATTRASSGDMAVSISLEPLPTISGRVVDASTGAPVSSFQVQLRQEIQGSTTGQTQAFTNSKISVSDPDGRFELTAPKAGTYIVEAIARGFADTYSDPFETVMSQDTSGIVVRMTRGGVIVGRVLSSDGEPIQGAAIETHDETWSSDPFGLMLADSGIGDATETSTRTGADGSFRLDSLKAAGYQLRIRHRDHASKTVTELTLGEGEELRVPDVRLPRGATISGTVLGPTGTPLASAQVQVVPMVAGVDVMRTQAGSDGKYTLKNVPAGRYKISAQRPTGNDPFGGSVDIKRTERAIVIQEGQDLAGEDFTLKDR